MKLIEILTEKRVESTWITELLYTRPTRTLTMKLSNGKAFAIAGISRTTFERWLKAPSKGRFWHNAIKGVYKVNRIK